MASLSHDALCIALQFLDYPTLFQCSLVNSELNRIASRLLYCTVHLQVASPGSVSAVKPVARPHDFD
jgi:hypothetical protein